MAIKVSSKLVATIPANWCVLHSIQINVGNQLNILVTTAVSGICLYFPGIPFHVTCVCKQIPTLFQFRLKILRITIMQANTVNVFVTDVYYTIWAYIIIYGTWGSGVVTVNLTMSIDLLTGRTKYRFVVDADCLCPADCGLVAVELVAKFTACLCRSTGSLTYKGSNCVATAHVATIDTVDNVASAIGC